MIASVLSHLPFCDRLWHICPYEVAGKFHYLRSDYASHYFVNYAVTVSCKYWMNSVIIKEHFFEEFAIDLIFKHLYSIIKIMFCFLYMRKNFVRKYTLPSKRKVYMFLAISESNKIALFILFNAYCTSGIT